ncbi:MAG TPA: hypothetical protein P5572_20730, partial [Phycisphaerae bacterium]|nr:hypothetical protein [Phycisphaerae bacterium]
MPHVVNGCGTWYYGKRNREEHVGVCRSCGATTTLTSYDTRLYAVFLMVPIVPLRRRRIIEQCASCKRHLVLPLKDWQVAQERARTTLEAYRAARGDVTLAEECLRASIGYRDQAMFLTVADELAQDFAHDARMLCLLAGGYDTFSRLEDEERVLNMALAVEDDAETREALAHCLLRLKRPEEAEPLLQHIIDQGIPDRVDHLYFLGQCWQAE